MRLECGHFTASKYQNKCEVGGQIYRNIEDRQITWDALCRPHSSFRHHC